MSSLDREIKEQLDRLIGLPLCISRRAADMLVLHFGKIRESASRLTTAKHRKGTVGEFSLHIQCPWRLETADGIITGRGDLYRSAETGEYFDDEIDNDSLPQQGSNLQDRKMGKLLQGIEPVTGSYMNVTSFLIVENTEADSFGGATIHLSGGYSLRIFPFSSKGEYWRLFQAGKDEKHFVVGDSKSKFE